MSDCNTCVVRNRAICASLTADEIQLLGQLGRKQRVAPGQSLIWEGDESLVVANVIDGVFKLTVSNVQGKEQIVGIVFPSDFIGRPFGEHSPYSVTALTEGEVCMFTRQSFDNFARQHPELEHKLLHRTLDELDNARKWMQLLGQMNAEQKLANFLLVMSNRLAGQSCAIADPSEGYTLPFGRQQIADLLGLTIETVSRQFTKMRGKGIIELPNRRDICIRDRAALEILAA
ncbi:Crp/Fnr family transcriptional regulator [Sphingorhabdus arenilitoris]|uniref:Crp/Fnr family transcriptional regulator n=1 Tax=Sphingorhabdus arenilitoris TaxID=1490041 RepID=A0ABV8REU0_9SPHN